MTSRHSALRALRFLTAACAFAALVANARADTIVVTTTADGGPDAPVPGSLRAALAAANDGDVIDATGITGTITLKTGAFNYAELLVGRSVTILGPGPGNLTVDANKIGRVFRVAPGHTVVIDGLTITNGVAWGGFPDQGGGIFNDQSELTVINCIITGNTADLHGGAIFNRGFDLLDARLNVIDSVISGNSALKDGGGIYNEATPGWGFNSGRAWLSMTNSSVNDNSAGRDGGGIMNKPAIEGAIATLSNCSVNGNSAVNGGAILNAGSMEITHCTLDGNVAQTYGGALYNGRAISDFLSAHNFASFKTVASTFSRNSAGSAGGGIFNNGAVDNEFDHSFASVLLGNATVSGNSAGIGGAIASVGRPSSGVAYVTILACTLAENSANIRTGGIDNVGGLVEIGNTILKHVQGGNLHSTGGSIFSRGFNLSSDTGGGYLNGISDQWGLDPLLGPLADNGGPTLTHLPLLGSPAIDRGASDVFSALGVSTDQRGVARTFDDPGVANAYLGNGTDIGALEVGASTPPPPPSDLADLLVSLGIDKTGVKQGELLTYTVTVQNLGRAAATNVLVNNTLSSGTTFVSAHAVNNRGFFTTPPVNQTGVVSWHLGTLANGDLEAAKLVVTVIVKGKTTITNTASVITDSEDSNLANNVAAITTSVAQGGSGDGGNGKGKNK